MTVDSTSVSKSNMATHDESAVSHFIRVPKSVAVSGSVLGARRPAHGILYHSLLDCRMSLQVCYERCCWREIVLSDATPSVVFAVVDR